MTHDKSVLFVCLGNICRSPIAEVVFLGLLKERGLADKWLVDSAAIGPWHVGSRPDHRALSVLKQHGLETNNRARQLTKDDFETFDYIFGMDHENIADINRKKPKNSKAKVELLGSYDPEGVSVIEDPYYTPGEDAFHITYDHCKRSCEAFLNSIL